MTSSDSDTGPVVPSPIGTGPGAEAGERAWIQAVLDVEVAHARARARLGIIPVGAAIAIGAAARADRLDLTALGRTADPATDLVTLLRAAVADRDPAAARHVRCEGTGQDVVDSAAMVLTARVADRVLTDLHCAAAAAAVLAGRHRSTPMIDRTAARHAVPTTFGLTASGWLLSLGDARDRVRALRSHGLPAQIACADGPPVAGAGHAGGGPDTELAVLPVLAAQLDLCEPVLPWYSRRTPFADIAAVAGFVAGTLGRIAAEVREMSRAEVSEITESLRGPGTAQVGATALSRRLLAVARQVPVHAVALTQVVVFDDEPGRPGTEWRLLRECLRLLADGADTAARLLAGLVVHPDRMRANLESAARDTPADLVLRPAIGHRHLSAAEGLVDRALAHHGRRSA